MHSCGLGLFLNLSGFGLEMAECTLARSNHRIEAFLLLVASLLLVVRPGAPSSVLAPSSDALCSCGKTMFKIYMFGASRLRFQHLSNAREREGEQ